MTSCLMNAAYLMYADVMKEKTTFDPDTNETLHSWEFDRTIKCNVIPYTDGGIRGMGSTETFNELYRNMDYARVKTRSSMSKRDRVTNVRSIKTGELLWYEEEGELQATVFNVDGSAPDIHPLTGRPVQWIISLSRAEVRR